MILFSLTVDKLSKHITLYSLFISESQRFEPMNPAPPVTKNKDLFENSTKLFSKL